MLNKKTAFLLLLTALAAENSLGFYVTVQTARCVQEVFKKNIPVKISYECDNVPNAVIDVQVITQDDGIVYFKKKAPSTAQFTFTSHKDEPHDICFQYTAAEPNLAAQMPKQLLVQIKVAQGADNTDYEQLARKENLGVLELAARKVHDISKNIVTVLNSLKANEQNFRQTNEKVSERITKFGIASMCMLIAIAVWQIFYLKRFFKSKKLI